MRLAQLDVLDTDALAFRSGQQRGADVFGAIVAADRPRFAAT